MLSAYFAGKIDHNAKPNKAVELFDKFQTWLEGQYGKVMKVALKRSGIVLLLSLGIFILSILSLKLVKSTFFTCKRSGRIFSYLRFTSWN